MKRYNTARSTTPDKPAPKITPKKVPEKILLSLEARVSTQQEQEIDRLKTLLMAMQKGFDVNEDQKSDLANLKEQLTNSEEVRSK